jgi:hypothetical protein
MALKEDNRPRCPYCGITTWNKDWVSFMSDHDRPDGKVCRKAQNIMKNAIKPCLLALTLFSCSAPYFPSEGDSGGAGGMAGSAGATSAAGAAGAAVSPSSCVEGSSCIGCDMGHVGCGPGEGWWYVGSCRAGACVWDSGIRSCCGQFACGAEPYVTTGC